MLITSGIIEANIGSVLIPVSRTFVLLDPQNISTWLYQYSPCIHLALSILSYLTRRLPAYLGQHTVFAHPYMLPIFCILNRNQYNSSQVTFSGGNLYFCFPIATSLCEGPVGNDVCVAINFRGPVSVISYRWAHFWWLHRQIILTILLKFATWHKFKFRELWPNKFIAFLNNESHSLRLSLAFCSLL